MSRLSVLFFLLLLLSSCSNGTTSLGRDPSIDTLGPAPPRYDLEHDMFLLNEGRMYSPDWETEKGGITKWGWANRPSFNYIGRDDSINKNYDDEHSIRAGHGFDRIVAWGQVVASRERPTPNIDPETKGARVHIKDFRLYILRKDNHEWYEVLEKGKQVASWGGMYLSNFNGKYHHAGGIKTERGRDSRALEFSVTAGAGVAAGQGGITEGIGKPGFLNHFWWAEHPKIDPQDPFTLSPEENENPSRNVAGMYIVCKARLKGNYTADPRYLIQLGWDYRLSPDITDPDHDGDLDEAAIRLWDSDGNGADDGAAGRAKYVTPEWQYFTFHTFSPKEVKNIKFPGEQ